MLAAVREAANNTDAPEDEAAALTAAVDDSADDADDHIDEADEAVDGEGAGDAGDASGDAAELAADVLTSCQMATVKDWSDDETDSFMAGVVAERARMSAIDEATLPGHEDLAADAKFNSPVSLTEFLQRQTSAEKALRASRREALDQDEGSVAGLRSAHRPANPAHVATGPAMSNEDKWRADYSASAKLRAEFADAGDYVAFMKREGAGK